MAHSDRALKIWNLFKPSVVVSHSQWRICNQAGPDLTREIMAKNLKPNQTAEYATIQVGPRSDPYEMHLPLALATMAYLDLL